MRVQSFNRTIIDCDEVLRTLSMERLSILSRRARFETLHCCENCVKLDPVRFVKHERWSYGISLDYWHQNIVCRLLPNGVDRDYLFPMEIVSCCNHIHLMRGLHIEDWDTLKRTIHDPAYQGMIGVESKTSSPHVHKRRIKVNSCEFCFRELEDEDAKCPDCFPSGV